MVKKTYSLALSLTDRQKKRLVQGYGIRLKPEQMMDGDTKLPCDGKRHRRITKAHKNGKSCIFRLTPEEINGEGISGSGFTEDLIKMIRLLDQTVFYNKIVPDPIEKIFQFNPYSVAVYYKLDKDETWEHMLLLTIESMRSRIKEFNIVPHDVWMESFKGNNFTKHVGHYMRVMFMEALKQFPGINFGFGITKTKKGGAIVPYDPEQGARKFELEAQSRFRAQNFAVIFGVLIIIANDIQKYSYNHLEEWATFINKAKWARPVTQPYTKFAVEHKRVTSWFIAIMFLLICIVVAILCMGYSPAEIAGGIWSVLAWKAIVWMLEKLPAKWAIPGIAVLNMIKNVFERWGMILPFGAGLPLPPTPPIPMKKSRSKKGSGGVPDHGPIDQIPEGYECAPYSMFQSGHDIHCKYVPKKSGSGRTGPVNQLPAGYTCAPYSMFLSNGVAYCTYQRKGKIPDILV